MARVKFLASQILGKRKVRKVRVQLEGSQYLHMSEVQVFDQNGSNVALNKPATQSSTYIENNLYYPASNAVDGNTTTFSKSLSESGT